MAETTIGEYTIVAKKTPSGYLDCKVYKGRCKETRTEGEKVLVNGRISFLAKSIEKAKEMVRREYGCDTQSSLEDFR